MNDELTLNLVFSATLPLVWDAPVAPTREVRIAHNQSRRLLADLYGYEASEELFRVQESELLFRRSPIFQFGLIGIGLAAVSMLYMLRK